MSERGLFVVSHKFLSDYIPVFVIASRGNTFRTFKLKPDCLELIRSKSDRTRLSM